MTAEETERVIAALGSGKRVTIRCTDPPGETEREVARFDRGRFYVGTDSKSGSYKPSQVKLVSISTGL